MLLGFESFMNLWISVMSTNQIENVIDNQLQISQTYYDEAAGKYVCETSFVNETIDYQQMYS